MAIWHEEALIPSLTVAPRLVLVNGLRPETSVDLYEDLAQRLRARGVEVLLRHGLDHAPELVRATDVLVSNIDLPARFRRGQRVYAGRKMDRPTSLGLIEHAGLATMAWTLARTRRDVRRLFETWSVDRLILKPSFSHAGQGVRVFSRGAVWRLRWDRRLDVICREVNPDDGDVYKAELFNGELILSWVSHAPPIGTFFSRGIHAGLRGAYGDRAATELPVDLIERLRHLSRQLTARGLAYVSVDLMRCPDGNLVVIELNPRDVATWWTRQFPEMRARYADALHALVVQR